MGTPAVVVVDAPIGSSVAVIGSVFGPYVITTSALNSLANNTQSAALTYSNPPGGTLANVQITLGSITPGASAEVQIISGLDGYRLTLDTSTTARSLVFLDIPVAFLASFTVKNVTGVSFASGGNAVVILPQ